jgi:hypothetical protein
MESLWLPDRRSYQPEIEEDQKLKDEYKAEVAAAEQLRWERGHPNERRGWDTSDDEDDDEVEEDHVPQGPLFSDEEEFSEGDGDDMQDNIEVQDALTSMQQWEEENEVLRRTLSPARTTSMSVMLNLLGKSATWQMTKQLEFSQAAELLSAACLSDVNMQPGTNESAKDKFARERKCTQETLKYFWSRPEGQASLADTHWGELRATRDGPGPDYGPEATLADLKPLSPVHIPTDLPALRAKGLEDDDLIKGMVFWLDETNGDAITVFIEQHRVAFAVVVGAATTRSIPFAFLYGSPHLRSVLFVLPGVTEAGDLWMSRCPKLRHVSFAGVGNLETVGVDWLTECSQLQHVAFDPLTRLRSVHDNWLGECGQLRSVSFAGLVVLETVGDGWLQQAYELQQVDLGDLAALNTVGRHWLSQCRHLTTVSFTGLKSLSYVGSRWLANCMSLETVTFDGLSKLRVVGSDWLYACLFLHTASLVGVVALESVGHNWLGECIGLVKAPLFRDLVSLKTVGDGWLSECNKLEEVSFEGLGHVEKVGHDWLSACIVLHSATFVSFGSLRSVGNNWLKTCSEMTSVSFVGCKNLETVGSGWLEDCYSLQGNADFRGLRSIRTIGRGWLKRSLFPASSNLGKRLQPVGPYYHSLGLNGFPYVPDKEA